MLPQNFLLGVSEGLEKRGIGEGKPSLEVRDANALRRALDRLRQEAELRFGLMAARDVAMDDEHGGAAADVESDPQRLDVHRRPVRAAQADFSQTVGFAAQDSLEPAGRLCQ